MSEDKNRRSKFDVDGLLPSQSTGPSESKSPASSNEIQSFESALEEINTKESAVLESGLDLTPYIITMCNALFDTMNKSIERIPFSVRVMLRILIEKAQ